MDEHKVIELSGAAVNDDRNIDHSIPHEVYTIAHFTYGIAIRGELPQHIYSVIVQLFQNSYGYDVIDPLIAELFGAVLVMTTRKKGEEWRKELGITS